jgi:hypothetical protein
MAGTEGTGAYVVIGRIPLGGKIGARIGIRSLELISGAALERNKARQAHTWREMFRR